MYKELFEKEHIKILNKYHGKTAVHTKANGDRLQNYLWFIQLWQGMNMFLKNVHSRPLRL